MYRLVRRALLAHSNGDAEEAHDLACRIIQRLQVDAPLIIQLIAWWHEVYKNPKPVTVFGISFPNPVGLPAGFDKDGKMLPFLQALGFGFLTMGTVVPLPQPGNKKPRLTLIEESQAALNSFGFNSEGLEVNMRRLSVRSKIRVPLIISVGKNLSTPLEEAAEDYARGVRGAWPLATIIELCLSSPNTPGLRSLQDRERVEALIARVNKERETLRSETGINRPILLKVSPDLTLEGLDDVLAACGTSTNRKADGLVIGNTTTSRPGVDASYATIQGGYSGPRLYRQTKGLVEHACSQIPDLPVVAVGGINHVTRAQGMLDVGASLVEILTGFMYQGPKLITDTRRHLSY